MGECEVHEGHRERMRRKFALHGDDVFDSYELLEMLLYFVLPYRDTNPPAHRLLNAFGDLDGVFSQPRETLVSVSGIGEKAADFLLSAAAFGSDALSYRGSSLECFDSYDKVARFFLNRMADCEKPVVDVLFLDNRMRGIAAERLYEMDFSSGAVNPISCVKRALFHHASVAVLAHSRLHGALYPTESDRAGYRLFSDALALAGIKEVDHFLVLGDKLISLKSFRSADFHELPELDRFYETYPDVRVGTASPAKAEADVTSLFKGQFEFLSDFFSPLYDDEKRKEQSKILLSRFCSVERTFSADFEELKNTNGIDWKTAFYLRLCLSVSIRRVTEKFPFGKPVTAERICDYFISRFVGKQDEEVLMMTFDGEDKPLGVYSLSKGTVNSSNLNCRACLEIAVKNDAVSVILAHNHPGGVPEPSNEDFAATQMMAEALLAVNIKLKDHLIVAGNRCLSVFQYDTEKEKTTFHFITREGEKHGLFIRH